MTDSAIAFKSANELAAMIQQKTISSEELLDLYLRRVDQFNPDLNAIIVFDIEKARERARQADAATQRGECWGPLHGVPMTIKESYNIAGLPTTFGNPDFANNIADEDALSVQRLLKAGVVIFGKTNVPLALADFQSYNAIYGTTNNPWGKTRTPGGSSGGSAAALAAGITGFECGSDIGGSIRNPAHFCGVFGHKPTWGILPPRGHALPGVLAQSDLSVIGPMARSAHDLEIGVLAMAGPDEIQSHGLQLSLPRARKASLSQYKVAVWSTDDMAPVATEVENRIRGIGETIASAGGQVDYDARPAFEASTAHDIFQTLLQATMSGRIPDGPYRKMQQRAAALGDDDTSTRAKTMRRQVATHRDVLQANEARTRLRWAWHEFFKEYDAIVTPMMAVSAFEHDQRPFGERSIMVDDIERPYFEQVFWAGLAISSYLPATVIPTGPDATGLPIGAQIIGPEYGDLNTIELASHLEAAGYAFVPPPGY
ncbi:MAG: amidase [Gammaproteobacteria bacterium]|nr:amidase [Gammaproteobacteria bacterium]